MKGIGKYASLFVTVLALAGLLSWLFQQRQPSRMGLPAMGTQKTLSTRRHAITVTSSTRITVSM